MRHLAISAACLALGACTTVTANLQSPTPTEQLLRSHPAERAAARENLRLPAGAKVFVQITAGDDTPAGKYAAAAFRAHLGARADLVDDRAAASVVVELRISAAGIDDAERLIGLPSMSIPAMPGRTTSTTTTPEIALFSLHSRTGVVEMSATARDAKTGKFLSAVGPLWAETTVRRRQVLAGLTFGAEIEPPGLQTRTSPR